MKDWQWLVDTFTFIGMVVSILITLIAIVWLTCFFVKLLVKTFNVRVGKSYELMVEDINKKSESKKERNEKKRNAAAEKKMEMLNMKLESKQKIHEMKKQKLAEKLKNKENSQKIKLFGENVEDQVEIKESINNEAKENTIESNIEVNEIEKVENQEKTKSKSKKK